MFCAGVLFAVLQSFFTTSAIAFSLVEMGGCMKMVYSFLGIFWAFSCNCNPLFGAKLIGIRVVSLLQNGIILKYILGRGRRDDNPVTTLRQLFGENVLRIRVRPFSQHDSKRHTGERGWGIMIPLDLRPIFRDKLLETRV